jgi:hypothetical protein
MNDVSGGFKEGETRQINLSIKTEILEICLKYLHYKVREKPTYLEKFHIIIFRQKYNGFC